MGNEIKHSVSNETLTLVPDCHRNYDCLLEELDEDEGNCVFCNKLSVIDGCRYRFGETLPKPICMCWVKRKIHF